MRVLFLSHYFPPEIGAASGRVYETAHRLAEFGHQVTVLTGFPHYPTGVVPEPYRSRWHMSETTAGMEVARTWVWATPNRTATRRILNQLSLAGSSLWGARSARNIDVIVVESPPLLLSTTGYLISRWKDVPLVLRIADLWPSSAVHLGVLKNRAIIRAAEVLERFIYRKADRIAAVTAGIRDNLVQRGFPGEKICHLPNGVDTSFFSPNHSLDSLRESFALQGKFVVLYAGNIGLAQGLGSVLEAATILRSEPDVQLVLVGEGVERTSLEARARREGLDNVSFLGGQPRDLMPAILNMADVALVCLVADPFFRMAVPSKLLEAMACQRPVVLAARGESEGILAAAGAGVSVQPEDPREMAHAIVHLKDQKGACDEMGRRGREYVAKHLDWTTMAERFESLLDDLIEGSKHGNPAKIGR